MILDDVVVGMAQDFIGANNIPWFTRDGQFGTRYQGGKDAAETRYSYTRPDKLTGLILRKEDRPILNYVVDEGEDVEPETYYPIIPMVLVNGTSGIGTGYSTLIPCHNPLDIINVLRLKLKGAFNEDLPMIFPWYNGFSGVIKVIDRRDKKKKGEFNIFTLNNNENKEIDENIDDENIDENLNDDENDFGNSFANNETRPLLSMITYGKYTVELNGTVIITELPIGRWPHDYHKWLEVLVEDKQITGFRDLSVDNSVYFEIYGFAIKPTFKSLKLQRTMGMSNMVLLDENSRPFRYNNANDIIDKFYEKRLPIYNIRKEYILNNLSSEIKTLNHKIQFIQAVINGQISIINKKKSSIYEALDKLLIPHEIYDKSMNHHLSEDDITDLNLLISEKQKEHDIIKETRIEKIWLNELAELEEAYKQTLVKTTSQKVKVGASKSKARVVKKTKN